MPMEKAMNIKIKINHRRTSAMEDDEKNVLLFFHVLIAFPAYLGVIYVDKKLPSTLKILIFAWNTLECSRNESRIH